MTRPPARAARSLLVALTLSAPCASEAEDPSLRSRAAPPWYVPQHAKLQLAGQIGFLSPGVGYEVAGRRVHLDVFLGWVPARIGGDDIYSVTGKATYAPWRLRASRWRVEPVRAALQLTYTFGSQYFLRSPDRYPSGYYDLPTALHAGVALGGAVTREGRGDGRELGLYYELVALPTVLRDWWDNRTVLDARDVFSLALGAMVRF